MKKILTVMIALWTLFPAALHAAPNSTQNEGIAAVINDDAVTISDLEDRLKLMIISSGMPYNDDMRNRLRGQVLNMLLDEVLQVQEARAAGVVVDQEEVSQGFATIAQNNNMPLEQFKAVLGRSGIRLGTLEDQIRAQISWGKVVQKKLRPQVDVTDRDIDERLAFLESALGKVQYQVAEIFLPVEGQAQDADVSALAARLVGEMKGNKAPFQQVASQFSQGAAAARGGDLGWVQEGQLPDPLNQILIGMAEGGISDPVRSLTGYHILLLRGKRTVQAENLPTREQVLNQIGTERLDRLQRRYLMDLKAESFVERRV